MLCYVTLCCVMLCDVIKYCVIVMVHVLYATCTSYYAVVLCYLMLCCIALCSMILCVILCSKFSSLCNVLLVLCYAIL